jgi:hypothetical protein
MIDELEQLGYTVVESHPAVEVSDDEDQERAAILHIDGYGVTTYVPADDTDTLHAFIKRDRAGTEDGEERA